jgi:tRNA(His) 5'-end guanylyltransferase
MKNKMKDDLGNRMKEYYEDRTRTFLPRRTYTIIRIDGKAFHTYTRGLERPFDKGLIDDMDAVTKFLCESIQGVKFGYVQSDEISLLLTDFDKNTTDAWFDGNIQKMASISASLATSKFNQLRTERLLTSSWNSYVHGRGQEDEPFFLKWDFTATLEKVKLAQFDSRVFTIPSEEEVINYFIWRQQDATRNSIQSVAQSMYSHKDLNGKTTDQMQEMIFVGGQNWNDFPIGQKRGRSVAKRIKLVPVSKQAAEKAKDKSQFVVNENGVFVERNAWTIVDPPIFTQDKDFIRDEIYQKKEKEA